jgi:hypothetical protein
VDERLGTGEIEARVVVSTPFALSVRIGQAGVAQARFLAQVCAHRKYRPGRTPAGTKSVRGGDELAGYLRPAQAAPQTGSYGVAEGLGGADGEPDALMDGEVLGEPDALGSAEKLGSGAGVGDGKSVVGTFANESAKMRMKMTTTISTHGRARVSPRGGSAPR